MDCRSEPGPSSAGPLEPAWLVIAITLHGTARSGKPGTGRTFLGVLRKLQDAFLETSKQEQMGMIDTVNYLLTLENHGGNLPGWDR